MPAEKNLSSNYGPEITVRRLSPADIPAANELRRLANWNQVPEDWPTYLEFEPDGCFVAEVGGAVVGTTTTISYDARFSWIGLVLVHPEHRRRGIGSALMRDAIDYLHSRRIPCIKLDATILGKKVYVALGFQDEYEAPRFEGIAAAIRPEPLGRVEAIPAASLAEVIAFDAPIFGAARPQVITSLAKRYPEWCFVSRDSAGVTGYIMAREGSNAIQVGPWVVRDPGAAESLLHAVFRRVAGRKVFVDVPGPNRAGCELMARLNFTVQRTFLRMRLGENRHPGVPQQVYSIGGPEKG